MTQTQRRAFSRSSDPAFESPKQKTQSFLLSLGYSEELSEGIIDALLQNGISVASLLGMVKSLAGRYEVDEDAGLEPLAASVQIELDKKAGKAKVKVWCLPSTGWDPAPDDINNDDDDADAGDQQLPIVHSPQRAFEVEAIEGTMWPNLAPPKMAMF